MANVNLDAMIPRADFELLGQEFTQQLFKDFPISNLEDSSPVRGLLRKPDFQRETNHWSPDQIVTFLESFLENELIPSLILWKSSAFIFVIDGGHRLSALRAWMNDDYGDGAISIKYYGGEISDAQKRIAKKTRKLVESKVGRYTSLKSLVGTTTSGPEITKRAGNLVTRALDLQWVQGNSDVAEKSFFKINSQGTPLNDIEEMLLVNRKKAIAIASRAILRAGTGNKYWARFPDASQKQIEAAAEEFHNILFDPEADSPIKTLDLPLGGPVSPHNALSLLIDFLEICASTQSKTREIEADPEDVDGSDTLTVLKYAKEIASRLTGNGAASLGLHPAVYFYNEHGVHARHLFLGTVRLIAERVRNNDDAFFKNFSQVRAGLEEFLITNKPLISQMFANVNREARVTKVRDMLVALIKQLTSRKEISTEDLLASIGFTGRILDIQGAVKSKISDNTKSAVFLRDALAQSLKCSICGGRLMTLKSVSFDHIVPKRDGGGGNLSNVQMAHPYCNTGIKN
ncbi:MAG: DUF262 domain-containing protein [Rhodospirillales bacterium]|nr:DUF262 domain-containing protein [Rhodospirillales bacterium]